MNARLLFIAMLTVAVFGRTHRPAPAQQPKGALPTAEVVADLLKKEPFTLESWPVWRQRLLDWIGDRSRRTDAAYRAGSAFLKSQTDAQGMLPKSLESDNIAWYFLAGYYLYDRQKPDIREAAAEAEKALRKSIALDANFARAHRNLALAILFQAPRGGPDPRPAEVDAELANAARLDPRLPLDLEKGQIAMARKHAAEAESHFTKAHRENPDDPEIALALAFARLTNEQRLDARAPRLRALIEEFPNDGPLACLNSLALAADNNWGAAYRELQRARGLGADTAKWVSPQFTREIEERGAPGWPELFGSLMLYFAAFYAGVMLLMALMGLVLASRTRGSRALGLLESLPDHLVDAGQVARASGETLLARLYALGLFVGLVLFYAAIPFVIVGLLGTTALLIYLIFMVGHIPVKLIILIFVLGCGGAWSVFKSLFSKPAEGSFGVAKTADDCPRLAAVIDDVSRRVDTDPVAKVYLSPGSEIGVHQTGRGPFGLFGVKSRVLTLGLSTMRFLTVSELEAILAHEYAHFSHRDTFYSRFIYQVHLSIGQALWGMGSYGGYLNYVNPFYWFLYLYYKSYSLLSAGFSRSREFLADRMAASLYGADVFISALTKASTDGPVFEKAIFSHLNNFSETQTDETNIYEIFRNLRAEPLSQEGGEHELDEMLADKASLFAQHPTVAERLDAIADMPHAVKTDASLALDLFDNPAEVELELSQFLTSYFFAIRQLQMQAAQNAG